MKNIFIILSLFLSLTVDAQLPKGSPYPFSRGWERQGFIQADSGIIHARRDTFWTPRFAGTSVWYNQQTFVWEGFWRKQTSASVSDFTNTIDSAKWVTRPKHSKDSSLFTQLLLGKSNLPDGLTKTGTVLVSGGVNAAIAGFYGNYLSAPIKLPDSTIVLAANGLTYDRIDAIYYNPATNTYGKVNGAEIENPIKPIPAIPVNTYLIANVRRNVNGTNAYAYGPVTGFVSFDKVESIAALKNFNGGISSENAVLEVGKPINSLGQTGFYVNHERAFRRFDTQILTDTTKLFGNIMRIPIGAGSANHGIYGPYENRFAPGDWTYAFRLKVSDNTSSTDMIFVDIAINGVTWTDHFLTIKPTDFPDTVNYKTFRIPFTAEKNVGYEFRVRNIIGPNPINIDFDYGIATQPATVTELNVTSKKPSHPYGNVTETERLALIMTASDDGGHLYQIDGTKGVYVYKAGTGWVFAY